MTDRVGGFLVVLGEDVREDDAEATLVALRTIRGVVKVEPVVTGVHEAIARSRLAIELGRTLYELARLVTSGEPVEVRRKDGPGGR